MVETDQQSKMKEMILYWFHFIFILIFFIEFLLKIISLRKHYFTSGWNILDFVVLVASIAGESVPLNMVMSWSVSLSLSCYNFLSKTHIKSLC